MILGSYNFYKFASAEVNTHEFGRVTNTLAQWCTSWCHQLRACVQNPGINPRGIMCLLLDGVGLGVQALREEPLEEAGSARSFLVVLAHKITRHLTMG